MFALIARTVQDRSRAEDLAQDVFLRIHRGPALFPGRSASFHLDLPHRRQRLRAGPRDARRAGVSLDDERGDAPAPSASDRQFGDLELRDRLEKAIARLPANYRLVVAAHYLEGVQYEDLAEALQLPLGTVKTQLHRAKQQLQAAARDLTDVL